ncbi:GH3 auxin-responsive promoter family protein [Marivirga salinae]|uniref:GH3 auxin-responsive promoter family protein n=1 Tax=Marivirga salinarum TaxID=3059078 RepID=A0AA49J9V6_9BACT|nr:GH3 auxin-responsive promoter family protein [Marivirga sp. BDSF4-3]WKK78722.2 GH3 auxin-responsive promoter family protein [Marivirga sp. BDSF4-3]
MKALLINSAWLFSQKKLSKQFHHLLDDCKKVQEAKLTEYLKKNADTEFGKKYDFKNIKSYQEYVKAVPIIEDYSDIEPYIENMKEGKENVLFPGKPSFFETTSGSGSSPKFIPYNNDLKNEFKAAVAVWMWDLYRLDPKIFSGKAYWSLSPAMKELDKTSGGIAVGTADDSDYFDPFTALLLKEIFAVPSELHKITDSHSFYVKTWQHLLHNSNLTFISVWSPQFLIRLIDFLIENLVEILSLSNCGLSRETMIKKAVFDKNLNLEMLFPSLRLISCWTAGQSKIWLKKLYDISGNIPVQGKGLLSTEGVLSISIGLDKHLLAYTSHFYEFKNEKGEVYRADKILHGETYEVIITTGGGLYRYNTHDLVKCSGFHKSVPCLEFLGRSGNVSDLVGEKIAESSLAEIFEQALKIFPNIEALYLYPEQHQSKANYLLIIESPLAVETEQIVSFVETELFNNPYYKQAIDSGQLGRISTFKVEKNFTRKLTQHYQSVKKIKDGDLKLPLLFPPNFLAPILK